MGPINATAVESATKDISTTLLDLVRDVRTEIQDNGEFLLVRLEKESAGSAREVEQMIKTAASILERHVPLRLGDYAWMVNIEYRGALLDSDVGGKLGSDSD